MITTVLNKKNMTYHIDIKEYMASYETPFRALRRGGIRFTKDDSGRIWWKVFFWWLFIAIFIQGILEGLSMVMEDNGGMFDKTEALITMMPYFGIVVVGLIKAYKMKACQPIFEQLIQELGNMWPTVNLSKEEHDVIRRNLKKLNNFVVAFYWCCNTLIGFFTCRPYIAIIKRCLGYDVPLSLPLFYWLPFDPYQRGRYECLLLLQTWHEAIIIWWAYGGDMMYCILLNHITTNFDLMSVRIKNMICVPVDRQLIKEYPLGKTYQMDLTSSNKWLLMPRAAREEYFVKELKSILQTHRHLIRLSETIEELFSFYLLVNFLYSSIIICFCLFCCIMIEKWNEVVYKLFLIAATAQIWCISLYGNRLYESSSGVSEALYSCGWYTCSKKVNIPLLMMIQRAQKNVCVTTYGFSIISLETFTTILKTSWSYFTMLMHFYKPN